MMGLDLATILAVYIIGILIALGVNYTYFFREEIDPDRTWMSTFVAMIWPLAVAFRVYEWWSSF